MTCIRRAELDEAAGQICCQCPRGGVGVVLVGASPRGDRHLGADPDEGTRAKSRLGVVGQPDGQSDNAGHTVVEGALEGDASSPGAQLLQCRLVVADAFGEQRHQTAEFKQVSARPERRRVAGRRLPVDRPEDGDCARQSEKGPQEGDTEQRRLGGTEETALSSSSTTVRPPSRSCGLRPRRWVGERQRSARGCRRVSRRCGRRRARATGRDGA